MTVKGYYRHPTINRDQVVFVAEDDLWTVTVEGGDAHRLTANPGMEAFPSFSPDGKTVAFVGRDEGQLDVYAMPAAGGVPRRLTYFGADTRVLGWRKDGSAVIITSDYQQPFAAWGHLWEVPLEGAATTKLPWGPAQALSFRPRGEGVVISRNSFDPARWKRYRGGRAGAVWVDRNGAGAFEVLIKLAGNMANPIWLGSRIFFLSDHEGIGNLYSVTPDGAGLSRHTNHRDFYARFASSDGRRIVYQSGADIYLYSPEEDKSRRLPITLPSARPQRNRRFIPAAVKKTESISLSASGDSVGVVFRGGAYTMPLWEGSATRHGPVSTARQRLLTWLGGGDGPDGDGLVMVSDETGDDSIVVESKGKRRVVRGDFGRIRSIQPAPGREDLVALTNHRHELLLVNVGSSNETSLVHRSEHGWISGVAWGPEIAGVRYLAFSSPTSRTTSNVFLYDTKDGVSQQIGEPEFEDWGPTFDPSGRYLGFLSVRAYEPMADQHFHDYGFPRAVMVMLVPLEPGSPSPFAAANRAPKAPGAPPPASRHRRSRTNRHRPGNAGRPGVAFPIPPQAATSTFVSPVTRLSFFPGPWSGRLDSSSRTRRSERGSSPGISPTTKPRPSPKESSTTPSPPTAASWRFGRRSICGWCRSPGRTIARATRRPDATPGSSTSRGFGRRCNRVSSGSRCSSRRGASSTSTTGGSRWAGSTGRRCETATCR